MPAKKKFYAYFVPAQHHPVRNSAGQGENRTGVTGDWSACENIVSGKVGARYKAFESREDAERWLADGARYEVKIVPKLARGIYFDAGTGRGRGVEISVTDEKGKNLLHKAFSKKELNRFGKYLIGDDAATNNYGELLALKYALRIARKEKIKKIFGDSRLVIDYWSRWHVKRRELPEETVELAHEVAKLRERFEKSGGTVARISGAHNPADLGFH